MRWYFDNLQILFPRSILPDVASMYWWTLSKPVISFGLAEWCKILLDLLASCPPSKRPFLRQLRLNYSSKRWRVCLFSFDVSTLTLRILSILKHWTRFQLWKLVTSLLQRCQIILFLSFGSQEFLLWRDGVCSRLVTVPFFTRLYFLGILDL